MADLKASVNFGKHAVICQNEEELRSLISSFRDEHIIIDAFALEHNNDIDTKKTLEDYINTKEYIDIKYKDREDKEELYSLISNILSNRSEKKRYTFIIIYEFFPE